MSGFCLPKPLVSTFIKALQSGEIDVAKMMDMPNSAARRAVFAKVLGEDVAKEVNTLFESKMLLKDQQQGMIRWIKQLSGLSKEIKNDFTAKVERMRDLLNPADEKAFMADVVAKRLKAEVTVEEARLISKGADEMAALRAAGWNGTGWVSKEAQQHYGRVAEDYHHYVTTLLRDANALTPQEWRRSPGAIAMTIAGTAKSLTASLDASVVFRQGMKVLATDPRAWGTAMKHVPGDAWKGLKGLEPIREARAEILAAPNSMTGLYDRSGLAVGTKFQEAFLESGIAKVPLLGRLYNASDQNYGAAILRMRATVADHLFEQARAAGVDLTLPDQAKTIGRLANSMTGWGDVGGKGLAADIVNVSLFSPRWLKSNFDMLTMQRFEVAGRNDPAARFVRKKGAQNLLRFVGQTAGLMALATVLGLTAEWDPRSSRFGVSVGNTTFDITGGAGGLVRLAARTLPTLHNGQWGLWKKNISGDFVNAQGNYANNGVTELFNFFANRTSPLASMWRDFERGQTFAGRKIDVNDPATLLYLLPGLAAPMGIGSVEEAMNTPDAAPLLAVFILDGLGLSANSQAPGQNGPQERQIWDIEP